MNRRFILLGVIIGLYLVFAPYLKLPGVSLYDSKRILEATIFLILTGAFLIQNEDKAPILFPFGQKVTLSLFLFIVVGILSSLFAPNSYAAFRDVVMFLAVILLTFVLGYYASRDLKSYQKVILSIVVGYVTVYGIYFIGNYISAQISPFVPFWPDRFGYDIKIGNTAWETKEVLNFVNRRFFNHTQTWTFPILVGFLAYLKDKKVYYWLIFALISIWWVLVFASGARGTSFAVLISAVFIGYKYRDASKIYIKYFIFTLLFGGILYLLLYHVFMPKEGVGVSLWRDSSSGRLEMWLGALKTFVKNPVLGIGPYQFALIKGEPSYAHPHNFYIQILVEWGIIAFGALVFMLASFGKWLLKDFDNEQKEPANFIRMGLWGAITAAFVHAFFSGVLHTPMSQVWLVLIGAYFVGYHLNFSKKIQNEEGIMFRIRYAKYVLLVVMIGFTIFVVNDVRKLDLSNKAYLKKFRTTQMYPRFWGQGLIIEDKK